MHLSRIVFKKPRAGHKALSRALNNYFEDVDVSSSFQEDKFPGNPLKDGKLRWIHAERVKKGSNEMHLIDYQSSFLRLLDSYNKDTHRLQVGVHRCLLKYKGSQEDHVRSLVSVWPTSERDLIEVLLEDNQGIPRDIRGLMLLPVDQISDRAWHSMPVNPKKPRAPKDAASPAREEPPVDEYMKKYSSLVAVPQAKPQILPPTPTPPTTTTTMQPMEETREEQLVDDEVVKGDKDIEEIIGSRTVHTMEAVPLKEKALKSKIEAQLDSLHRGNVNLNLDRKGGIFKEKFKLKDKGDKQQKKKQKR